MSIVSSRGTDQFQLRLPDGMRESLCASAARNGRSMSSEIIARLQASSNSSSNSLSKREQFAGMAMQAIRSIEPDQHPDKIAFLAVADADALLAELAKGAEK